MYIKKKKKKKKMEINIQIFNFSGIDFTSVSSHIGLVLKNKEQEFLQLLRGLANAPFSIIDFSQVVETIRHCVSQVSCICM